MSRTDNTRPYYLQCDDPSLPGVIEHDHLRVYSYYAFVPVTWAMFQKRFQMTPYDVLFAACTGRSYDGSNITSAMTKEITRLNEGAMGTYFHTRQTLDPALPLNADTIIGTTRQTRFVNLTMACDYQSQGNTRNFAVTHGRFSSNPELIRCLREVFYNGGIRSMGRNYRKYRVAITRSERRRINVLLHLATFDGDQPENDGPVRSWRYTR